MGKYRSTVLQVTRSGSVPTINILILIACLLLPRVILHSCASINNFRRTSVLKSVLDCVEDICLVALSDPPQTLNQTHFAPTLTNVNFT